MGYELAGLTWTPESFRVYLSRLPRPQWAKAVCLHHTASPSLAMRPSGLSNQHIINLHDYYQLDLKWSSGPHLFVDDHRILGMSSLLKPGVHAKSFNRYAIGIEVLGEYDTEDPQSGRGLACWQNAAAATALLLEWLGLPATADTVLFHRNDPKTSKTCPGMKVQKAWVLRLVAEA